MQPMIIFLLFTLASCKDDEVFTFHLPLAEVENKSFIEFPVEPQSIEDFTVCFHFRLKFRFNTNNSVLLDLPGVFVIGIYKDSESGWLDFGAESHGFSFKEPLFPRIWYGMCVQVKHGMRKVWLKDDLIYEKAFGGSSFELKVVDSIFLRKTIMIFVIL